MKFYDTTEHFLSKYYVYNYKYGSNFPMKIMRNVKSVNRRKSITSQHEKPIENSHRHPKKSSPSEARGAATCGRGPHFSLVNFKPPHIHTFFPFIRNSKQKKRIRGGQGRDIAARFSVIITRAFRVEINVPSGSCPFVPLSDPPRPPLKGRGWAPLEGTVRYDLLSLGLTGTPKRR